MKQILLALIVLLYSQLAWAFSPAAPPKVVVSLKPIHALVAGVMDGVALPSLLLSGGSSPHNYTLRPSEAVLLRESQVVFWVGESLETFLIKPLATLARHARIVTLHELPGLQLHRNQQHIERHPDEADEDAGHHHPDEAGEIDMHLWLDPVNARIMVAEIGNVLMEVDPINVNHYRNNVAILDDKLEVLERYLAQRLASVQGKPFIVFHDAYRYFEERFGLTNAGSIVISPEHRPSVKRLHAIRSKILNAKALCVFFEPQFSPAIVDAAIRGAPVRKGVLDPIGANLPAGKNSYFQLLKNLGDQFVRCLQGH